MKKFFYTLISTLIIISFGMMFVKYYRYIFAKDIKGVVINIEKTTPPMAIIGDSDRANQQLTGRQFYSYAVAIQVTDGEIMTASTEDHQWAVVEKGTCVVAKFYPYPPWDFDKSGTYYDARLLRMYDCSTAK